MIVLLVMLRVCTVAQLVVMRSKLCEKDIIAARRMRWQAVCEPEIGRLVEDWLNRLAACS
jgi:hypothetical protein